MDSRHTMIGWIAKQNGPGALVRRCFTMFCVALFVFANVGHAVACTETSVNVIISDAASNTTDDDSDTKQTVLDENHCHGCVAVSIPVLAADISPIMKAAHVTLAPDYRVDADQNPSDPPPPKTLN